MRNIHILPTDKRSRLVRIYNDINTYNFTFKLDIEVNDSYKEYNHIYITSDEEVKERDWVYNIVQKTKFKASKSLIVLIHNPNVTLTTNKKIILTTDQDLIADGVQAIDDEFLKWFVMNPNCEEVKFEVELYPCDFQGNEIIFSQPVNLGGSEDYKNNIETFIQKEHLDNKNFIKSFDKKRYKIIIISKLAPKALTLEEVAKKYAEGKSSSPVFQEAHITDFINGAKWQQERSYSKEFQK